MVAVMVVVMVVVESSHFTYNGQTQQHAVTTRHTWNILLCRTYSYYQLRYLWWQVSLVIQFSAIMPKSQGNPWMCMDVCQLPHLLHLFSQFHLLT